MMMTLCIPPYSMITQGQDDDEKLTDGNNETFWESDGNHGQHWIRFVLSIVKRCSTEIF